jgi:hypothetical protein
MDGGRMEHLVEAQVIDSRHLKLKKTIKLAPGSTVMITIEPTEGVAEEYAVYRAFLAGADRVCLQTQTYSGDPYGCDDYPKLDPNLVRDYKTQNQMSVPLNPELDLGVPLVPSTDSLYFYNRVLC